MNSIVTLRILSLALLVAVLLGMVASNTIFNESLNFFTYFIITYLVISLILLVACLYVLKITNNSNPFKNAWSWVIVIGFICGIFVFVFPVFAFVGIANDKLAHTQA